MDEKSSRYVKLRRSGSYGFGFSIIGGAGSEVSPTVYDIISGSPADTSKQLQPGDVILEVNGKLVQTLTTKEVLNYLRDSPDEVILRLKTDAAATARVQKLFAAPNDPELLRQAITQTELLGINRILVKKDEAPPLPVKSVVMASAAVSLSQEPLAGSLDRKKKPKLTQQQAIGKMKNGCLDESFEDGEEQFESCTDIAQAVASKESVDRQHGQASAEGGGERLAAVRLAKRLYHLDGFKKTDVSRHLSKNNEFARAVAEEYLQHFDFTAFTLDQALRCFLEQFCLAGETQERERVLVHFSRRFLDCNPGTFNSQDAVHTLTCALMLLNTDLHRGHPGGGRAMTCQEFINNLAELNDGQDFCPRVLRDLHTSIRNKPLKWAVDDAADEGGSDDGVVVAAPVLVGSNPFLAPASGDGIIYKKGYIMRKCCTDPNGKKTSFGKRSWKMWWCVVQDLVLYLYKDEQCGRRGAAQPPSQLGSQAIRLHHALATPAHDYSKKQHVFRLLTADQAECLLQTSDSKELQGWISTINYVSASLSAPPMAGAVGSQKKFQRPLLPCSITKLNLRDQTADHQQRLVQLEAELEQHTNKMPDKTAKSNVLSNYKEKETYLGEEIKRYREYVYHLRSRLACSNGTDPTLPQPALLAGEGDTAGLSGERGNGRVVAPPIPDRGAVLPTTPGDSGSLNPFKNDDVDEPAGHGKPDETKPCQDVFKKHLVKIEKELEKREQKIQEQEKKDSDKKKVQERKNKEKSQQKEEKDKKRRTATGDGGEARLGTMNRLSALFKFSLLNRDREDLVESCPQQTPPLSDSVPPPLPPKPAPNSPIMRNVGTRFDL